MPRWRLWSNDDTEMRGRRWRDGRMDGWMGGWGGGGRRTKRRRRMVERWIPWHHVGSYKVREWSPGHLLSNQREAAGATERRAAGKEKREGEEEVEEEDKASFAASSKKKKEQQPWTYGLELFRETLKCWIFVCLSFLAFVLFGFFLVVALLTRHHDAATGCVFAAPLLHMWRTLHRYVRREEVL